MPLSLKLQEFFIGILKCLVVCVVLLVPLFLIAPLLGMIAFVAIIATPAALVVMGIGGVWAGARGNAAQVVGALCVLPLAYLAMSGATVVKHGLTRMAVNERYLSRVIEHPGGQIDTLVITDKSGNDVAADILVNGLAKRVINYYSIKEGYRVTTYTLGSGDECWPSPHTWSYAGEMQRNGVFDACVFSKPRVDVERLSEGIAEGMLIKIDGIRGGQGDAGIARLFGPSNVAVAYKISAGDVGDEYVRWEYDYDRRRKEWIGTKFEVPEMMRALTGLPSDRFTQALRLSPSEAVGTVHQAVLRRMPIADHAVRDYFYKLREHKEKEVAWKKPVPMELDAEDWRKLSEVAKAACAKDPNKAAECESQLMSSFKHVFRN